MCLPGSQQTSPYIVGSGLDLLIQLVLILIPEGRVAHQEDIQDDPYETEHTGRWGQSPPSPRSKEKPCRAQSSPERQGQPGVRCGCQQIKLCHQPLLLCLTPPITKSHQRLASIYPLRREQIFLSKKDATQSRKLLGEEGVMGTALPREQEQTL